MESLEIFKMWLKGRNRTIAAQEGRIETLIQNRLTLDAQIVAEKKELEFSEFMRDAAIEKFNKNYPNLEIEENEDAK